MAKNLYIIDGHAQIFRAYFAPFRDLTSPAGEPTKATYVFCTMLLKLIAQAKPDYLAMAIDGPAKKLIRREMYSEYKTNRPPVPEDFPPQVERIIEIVKKMGIPVLELEGYEADDILATAASQFASDDLRVVLVSRDKDLDQLVNPNVVLFDPMKNEIFDAAAIEAKKGYAPEKAVEIQTLMGDTSDNIPGVPGVGPKKAAQLIAKYGSAGEVLAHADELTPKLRENVLASAETMALSRQLVTLDCDAPIELALDKMDMTGIDTSAARDLFAELGFKRLVDQIDAPATESKPTDQSTEGEKNAAPMVSQSTIADADYELIDSAEKLDKLIADLAGVTRLAVDTETTSIQAMRAELCGISLSWKPGKGVYIPVKGPLGSKTLEVELVRQKLGPVLADTRIIKVGQNIKYDVIVLAQAGFKLAGDIFDTMVAAHVLDSTRHSYKMDVLAEDFLGYTCIPIEDLIGKGRNQITINQVPVETTCPYAAEDADITLRLADVLGEKLDQTGLDELFADLEMPLLPVLADMEMRGIIVDRQALKKMGVVLSKQADKLRAKILDLAGVDFNPDSPKQLAGVLFEQMGLPIIKKKKTGPSTDSSVLEELACQHELPGVVLSYRKLTKLLTTYVTALEKCINPKTKRVHTSFRQGGTSTGRLSSSDPNLQNIPIRSEAGKQIRSAFVAADGCTLLSADYSQVELRVLAHMSGDETLAEAFAADQDIHRLVASEIFGVGLDEVTSDQRGRAKTVNFGIIYGQTAFGLARTLRIGRNEAAEFIKAYKQRFPKIDEFLAECIESAKADGYVETIMGRRREITDISSPNQMRRSQAERLAINSCVQGSAADIIKRAMINIHNRIAEENRPSQMLLQIHDELVFEIPESALADEQEMIVYEMCNPVQLDVPLKVDVGIGTNWMDAK